jgi:hypothetical protein
MKLFKSLRICFAVILLGTPFFSLAQYKMEIKPFFTYFRDISRWEIGGNYMLSEGTFNGVLPLYGYNNRFLGDTTMKRGVSGTGYGVTLGTNVPFAATGHISCWAFSISAMGNFYSFDALNKAYNIDGTSKELNSTLKTKTIQIAVPVGLDWKIGCDAISTKRLRFGATVGFGVMPHFNITSLDSAGDNFNPQQSIGLNPYGKAEFSVFLGMLVKVRAMYNAGNVELMNSANTIGNSGLPPYTDGPFKVTSNSHMLFSLIILPFSGKWRETAWYNTYDSYNWNEHLN